jgi:hypothetical protein
MSYRVVCEDDIVRHTEPFDTVNAASHFVYWGHCCTVAHRIEPITDTDS